MNIFMHSLDLSPTKKLSHDAGEISGSLLWETTSRPNRMSNTPTDALVTSWQHFRHSLHLNSCFV